MFLEGVSVCVNYSDFLEHTLPKNKKHFDNLIIITTEADKGTQKVCNDNGVQFITTERFYENGAKFNKGKAINVGFDALKKTDWILHFDADMVMPDDFSDKLKAMELDVNLIYGAGRYLCPNYEAWERYLKTGKMRKWHYQGHGINIAMGFFQLFNVKSATILSQTHYWYPERFGHAGRSDRMFRRMWFGQYKKLEGIFPIHVESTPSTMGTNWGGRSTPKFGATSSKVS